MECRAGHVRGRMRRRERPQDIQWVFFDFDGTLSDTEPFGIELDRQAFASFGIAPTPEELCTLPGTTGHESIPAVFKRHGMNVSAQDYFDRRPSSDWIYFKAPLKPSPGVVELIDNLDERGVKRAIVSTTQRHRVEEALQRLEMADRFDLLVCGDEAGHHKPDPAPYLYALALAHVSANHAVVFEDSPTGIASARAAGIYTFGYRGSSLPLDTSLADEQIDSFEHFSF